MASKRDRNAKFIELANKRVNKTIKDIRLVGNLSNKAIYSYDDVQARKILKTLQKELDIVKAKFSGSDSTNDDLFKL